MADVAKTITPDPVSTLCKEGTANTDRAIQQFENYAKDGTLVETPLWSDDDECRLGFLGEQLDTPFLMVHTKPDYPFQTATERAPKRNNKPEPLRLMTGSQDSPLSDVASSPLSPLTTPDSISAGNEETQNAARQVHRSSAGRRWG